MAEERRLSREVIDRLGKDPSFRDALKLDPILWDDPEAPAPMLANLAPQESVNRVVRPSQCDIVVVLFWGRMGTPLDGPLKSDGTPYLSGTEWEYHDALRAGRDVLLFRRTSPVRVDLDDPSIVEKQEQQDRVKRFFKAIPGSFKPYKSAAQFAVVLESSLRQLLVRLVDDGDVQRADSPPVVSRETVRSVARNLSPLPLPHVRCLGRGRELHTLARQLLRGPRKAVVILGVPGIGKSTLAQALMQHPEVIERFADDRYFVRCDSVESGELLAQKLCEALKIAPVNDESPEAVLFRELKGDPTLLVIDNLETPWEAEPGRVGELLQKIAGIANVSLVATMRGSEPPCSDIWGRLLNVPRLDPRTARRLFLAEAKERELSKDPLLEPLIDLLDGVPLALVLVANATFGDSLKRVSERYKKSTKTAARTIVEDVRRDSLNASFELSIRSRRMTDPARQLLSILAVLPDGIRDCDVNAVLPGDGDSPDAVLCKLALAFYEADRLRVLSPLRSYVLGELPCPEAHVQRVMAFYRELLIDYGVRASPEGAAACTERLQPELRNIEAAIEHALASDRDAAVAASIALAHVMRYSGFGTTAFLDKVLTLQRDSGHRRVEFARAVGNVALVRAEFETAKRRFEEAREQYAQAHDARGEADIWKLLGDVAMGEDLAAAARAMYEDARRRYEMLGDTASAEACRGYAEIAGAKVPRPAPQLPEELFLAHLPVLERTIAFVVARNHLNQHDADDFASFVMLRMVADDYGVFRVYQGRASLRTYLSVVVQRLLLEYRVVKWGKWRPSAAARKAGSQGVTLEKLMIKDGFSENEAINLANIELKSAGISTSEDELRQIAKRIRATPPRRTVLEDVLRNAQSSNHGDDEGVLAKADADAADPVRSEMRKAVEVSLSALSTEERLIVVMRFVDNRPISDIAQLLRLQQKGLQRRLDRILADLRTDLERRGFSADDVRTMLESDED